MQVTATEAKNRFGQILDAAQRGPVVIGKAGRRHGVLLSAAHYDALVMQAAAVVQKPRDTGRAFYEKYKDWVDEQNKLVDQYGIPGDEFRAW